MYIMQVIIMKDGESGRQVTRIGNGGKVCPIRERSEKASWKT